MSGNDKKLRPIIIFKILQSTSPYAPISSVQLMKILEKEYNISVSRKTLYDDMACIETVEPAFRMQSGREKKGKITANLYWLEK